MKYSSPDEPTCMYRSLKSPKWRFLYRATDSASFGIFLTHRKVKVWVGRIESSDKYSSVVAPLKNHSFGHVLHFPFPRLLTIRSDPPPSQLRIQTNEEVSSTHSSSHASSNVNLYKIKIPECVLSSLRTSVDTLALISVLMMTFRVYHL